MTAPLLIRPATPADRPDLRQAIIELQDHEQTRHPTRLLGELIVDAYMDLLQRQAETDGTVLVAERGGRFIGFLACSIEEADDVGEIASANRFGYISDLFVMPAFRGQRVAAQLMNAVEQYLRRTGIVRMRVNARAANTSARVSYERAGFVPHEILFEKLIDAESDA